jgi:hypothetical protein
VVEILAIFVFAIGWAVGIINPVVVLLFVAVGLGYATFLTMISVMTEEITYHRYRDWRNFALLLYASVAENVGFRQIYAWWRLRGIIDAILRRKATWLENEDPAAQPEMASR